MKAFSMIAAFALGILVSCAPSTQTTTQSGAPITPRADGKQARLAVLSFQGQNGRELSDSLNTALFRTGRFILLERESLLGLQSEASIGQNPTAFEGADVVVVGSITAFEPNAGGTGGGINLPIIGRLNLGANEAYVAADLRIVEVKTRRILNIARVEGRSSSFNIGGVGGRFLGPVFVGGNLSTYANQPMGKAIAVMLEAAVQDLSKGIPEVYYVDPTATPITVAKPAEPAAVAPAATAPTNTTTQTRSNVEVAKVLPDNTLPFEDDFSSYPIGSALGSSEPAKYGLMLQIIKGGYSKLPGPGFAQIDEDSNGKKLLQINNGAFLTTGSGTWQNYRATFDLSQKKNDGDNQNKQSLYILLNINPATKTHYRIQLSMTKTATLFQINGQEEREIGQRNNANYDFLDGTQSKIELTSKKNDISLKIGGRMILEYRSNDANFFQGGLGFGASMYWTDPKKWDPFYIRNLKIEPLK